MIIEPISDEKWRELIEQLVHQTALIEAWLPDLPNLDAERCEFSRHRTLAHLRACQETWLESIQLFALRDQVSIVRPHPWRLIRDNNYELIPWDDHRSKFLADRHAWLELVTNTELHRDRGGRMSTKPRTIASLTELLVNHEKHHLLQLEQREARSRK